MEISRDKKNPTWAYVWDGDKPEKFTEEDRRIIIDACEDGCVCVCSLDVERYISDKRYSTTLFQHYEISKEPEYRPIQTLEDYLEVVKRRKSLRIVSKGGTFTIDLYCGDFDYLKKKIYFRGYDGEYLLENCVFCDDRSPVGVKVK
jgi:hypothetical protein